MDTNDSLGYDDSFHPFLVKDVWRRVSLLEVAEWGRAHSNSALKFEPRPKTLRSWKTEPL